MTNEANSSQTKSVVDNAAWKTVVLKYQKPSPWKAFWQIIDTLIPYALVWYLMYLCRPISWWLVLPLAILAGALLVRVFIIFHDCGHGSFFRSSAANDLVGFLAGILTFTPYYHWRWEHAIHHANAGNLDRRGTGDVWTMTVTMTVQEYLEASRWKRFSYRLSRNPFVLFVVAPLFLFVVLLRVSKAVVAILMLGSMAAGIMAQTPQPSPDCSYTLTDGSQLVDDCPVCDHLPIVKPMRGTFHLRLAQQSPLFSTYTLENLSFTAGDTNGQQYKVVGKGVYQIGGEVGLQQELFLTVSIDNGVTNQLCYFTNAVGNVTRLWPMLQIGVDQTNGTATQQFHLEIDAAPFLEIWFSTSQDFQSGLWASPTNLVSAGDLISSVGRVVKRNHELTQNLAPMPSVPDLWLKDVDVLPGGEIAFSIAASVWSQTLNTQLDPGDLLSDRGRILHTNQQLIAAFLPKLPPPNGAGLGAVQVMDNGEVDFSVQTNFFSTKLGLMIEPGDLLSDTGGIVRTGADLVRQFSPANPTNNCGLNAIYIWPSGEIWFSTQGSFYDTSSNYYAPGDLLSDQGYVVYRNWELLSAFQPAGSPADFGLDALFVITDVTPASPAIALGLPQLTNQPPASLVFQRIGGCRVFQLERATSVTGPYNPVSSITTETLFLDAGALTNQVQGFYRLHQW